MAFRVLIEFIDFFPQYNYKTNFHFNFFRIFFLESSETDFDLVACKIRAKRKAYYKIKNKKKCRAEKKQKFTAQIWFDLTRFREYSKNFRGKVPVAIVQFNASYFGTTFLSIRLKTACTLIDIVF